MHHFLKLAVSLSFLDKCVAAVIGILCIHAVFRVLEQTLPRRFGRADARYKVRKFVVFSGYLSILLFLAILFEDRLGRLSFAFGVAGAGVAVALQDVLASIAGAFSIGFSKLYSMGDRVQIGDTRGDVIDIGLLRTTLLETGNWVSRDLYNGRIVHIPNSTVLKGSVFNYSQGFHFIWDEIKVLFTTTSDCQLAREMLLRVAKEAIGEYLVEAQTSWKAMSDNYRSVNPRLEPTVALAVNAGTSFLRWHAFFSPSGQPLGDFAAIASQWILQSYIFNWKNQTFRADLILILPIAVCLGSDCGSIILLLEESQPAALKRVLTDPAC